jgi:hypothetical protein
MKESFDKRIRLAEVLSDRSDFVRHVPQLFSLSPMQILAFFEMIILSEQAPTSSRTLLKHKRQEQTELRLQSP